MGGGEGVEGGGGAVVEGGDAGGGDVEGVLEVVGHSGGDGEVGAGAAGEEGFVPAREVHEGVGGGEAEGEDCVAEVVPVDGEVRGAEVGD